MGLWPKTTTNTNGNSSIVPAVRLELDMASPTRTHGGWNQVICPHPLVESSIESSIEKHPTCQIHGRNPSLVPVAV